MIAIVIPTYHRANTLERVASNIWENTDCDYQLYFVVEKDDQETIEAASKIKEATIIINKYPGTHTGAANTYYETCNDPYFIMANDDFNFHKGWDTLALSKFSDKVGIVGVNDGMNNMTPITIVSRKYIREYSGCMDMPNQLYYPGYNHNFVDTEISQVCKKRGMWAEEPESIVEHMHWTFNKSPIDKTYEKSHATNTQDQILYESRKHLWEEL